MSEKDKGKNPPAKHVTFADASGKVEADFSIQDKVGSTISIKSFKQEDRTYKGRATKISYITLADGKIGYTWSETVAKQLNDLVESLASGAIVDAKVTEHKSDAGTYLSLE